MRTINVLEYLGRVILLPLMFLILCCSGTDVPISINSKVFNRNILGYWQVDNRLMHFLDNSPYGGVKLAVYDYINGKFEPRGTTSKVYFSDVKKGEYNYSFVSIKFNSDYTNYVFKIEKDKNLILWDLNYSLEGNPQNPQNTFEFKVMSKLLDYFSRNILNENLFGKKYVLGYKGSPNSAFERSTMQIAQKPTVTQNSNSTYSTQKMSEKTVQPASVKSYSQTIIPPTISYDDATFNETRLRAIVKYCYFDAYYIQSGLNNNPTCIRDGKGNQTTSSQTRVEYEYVPIYREVFGQDGTVTRVYAGEQKVQKDNGYGSYSTYSSQKVKTNVCKNDVYIWAILKDATDGGEWYFQESSTRLVPNEELKFTGDGNFNKQFDTNDFDLKNGGVYLYNYKLPINTDEYKQYINEVVNKDEGTLYVDHRTTRTRIYLNPGDRVMLAAEGRTQLEYIDLFSDPNGIDGYDEVKPIKHLKYGALVWKEEDTTWSFCGKIKTVQLKKPGFLWLTVNEDTDYGRRGYFLVNYKIIRAKR